VAACALSGLLQTSTHDRVSIEHLDLFSICSRSVLDMFSICSRSVLGLFSISSRSLLGTYDSRVSFCIKIEMPGNLT
jgi:hypothetical protein